uniref:Uncharacterized protein n=1 Tax=Triticum urartu TaxID=4572 RepID=A0A8R7R3Y5_TRIUA
RLDNLSERRLDKAFRLEYHLWDLLISTILKASLWGNIRKKNNNPTLMGCLKALYKTFQLIFNPPLNFTGVGPN